MEKWGGVWGEGGGGRRQEGHGAMSPFNPRRAKPRATPRHATPRHPLTTHEGDEWSDYQQNKYPQFDKKGVVGCGGRTDIRMRDGVTP